MIKQCKVGASMADDYFQHAAECPECSALAPQPEVLVADGCQNCATETAQREAAERALNAQALAGMAREQALRAELLATQSHYTAALTEAQRERDEVATAPQQASVLRDADMALTALEGFAHGYAVEHDAFDTSRGLAGKVRSALIEAQREREAVRVVAIRQADACRALRQGASPSYVHGVGTCREDAIPRERWCLYCDLAEALNL